MWNTWKSLNQMAKSKQLLDEAPFIRSRDLKKTKFRLSKEEYHARFTSTKAKDARKQASEEVNNA